MKQKVVIIGHGYTSRLGVIRALGEAGYEVTVIVMTGYKKGGKELNTTKPIDCYSKYVNKVWYCPSIQEELIRLLLDHCKDPDQKVVIIPDSDFSAAAIDLNQDRLREYFRFPHINHEPGAVVAWMNKLRQKEEAINLGLNVAKGWEIEVRKGAYVIPEEIVYPCFAKPQTTLRGGKKGLRRCDTEKQLREVIALITSNYPDITILVEEFKEIETEYALVGYTDAENVIIPGIIQTKSLANGGHFGVAKSGVIMPVGGFSDIVNQFERLVLRTGFVGIFDIDFYKSDGNIVFCEMNFRYGGSGYAYTKMGVNLPEIMVRSLMGESIDGMNTVISEDSVFVNERMCKDDWAEGYISSISFFRLLKSADISFIHDARDPEPGRRFQMSLWNPELNLKRIAKRLLRRK